MQHDTRHLARIALVCLLIVGCLLVLYPFVAPLLLAGVLCTSTWPLFEGLHHRLRHRTTLAALLMTLAMALLLLLPMTLIASQSAEAFGDIAEQLAPWVESGGLTEAPDWVRTLPFVGEPTAQYWHKLSASRVELMKALQIGITPLRTVLLKAGTVIAQGVIELTLVLVIAFFFYRDGHAITRLLRTAVDKLAGEIGHELLLLTRNTVNGVMHGIVGTALAQAFVMFIGLVLAGVPGAMLLAVATFFLSLVPVGPPLIWGGAALWLYGEGETGWSIFLAAWGLLAVSSVDNFLKPMLISRSASLPILLIALGVFGGLLAFGFIGIFLGPTLLALAYMLFLRWANQHGHPPFHE